MKSSSRIYIAGHRGMVGSAVVRAYRAAGFNHLILPSRAELDLCNEAQVAKFMHSERPDLVIVAAAKVGGIHANSTYPANFMRDNLAIALHTIHQAYLAKIPRLIFLGSSCIYPRNAPQPMTEECLLSSQLEPTNEPYAIAKIAGLKLCQYYRKQYGVLFHSLMPTNLYGPGDNYHPENSHVLPALIQRFHKAMKAELPSVTIWGSGTPLREFLHVDDLAAAILHTATLEDPPDWLNVGSGKELSIYDLAHLVAKIIGFQGELLWDPDKPDGSPRKLMDSSKINATGWRAEISLENGIRNAYQAFLKSHTNLTSTHI